MKNTGHFKNRTCALFAAYLIASLTLLSACGEEPAPQPSSSAPTTYQRITTTQYSEPPTTETTPAPTTTTTTAAAESESQPEEQERELYPIDRFFNVHELSSENDSNYQMTEFARAEMEAWKREVEHAYELFENAINKDMSPEGQEEKRALIRQARDSFMSYAEASAQIEAQCGVTKIFSLDEPDGEFFADVGTAYGKWECNIQASIYRDKAIILYKNLERVYPGDSIDELFIFDEADFLDELESEYELKVVLK